MLPSFVWVIVIDKNKGALYIIAPENLSVSSKTFLWQYGIHFPVAVFGLHSAYSLAKKK